VARRALEKEGVTGSARSAALGEDGRQFLRRHDFQLRVRAIARLFVGTPPAELRDVTKAVPLHVIVCNLGDVDPDYDPAGEWRGARSKKKA
jgi:hypothetical protein